MARKWSELETGKSHQNFPKTTKNQGMEGLGSALGGSWVDFGKLLWVRLVPRWAKLRLSWFQVGPSKPQVGPIWLQVGSLSGLGTDFSAKVRICKNHQFSLSFY